MVRRIVVEVGVSGGAIAILIAVLIAGSTMFSANGTLTRQGGLVAIAGIALFVLVLGGAGYWLATTDYDAE